MCTVLLKKIVNKITIKHVWKDILTVVQCSDVSRITVPLYLVYFAAF